MPKGNHDAFNYEKDRYGTLLRLDTRIVYCNHCDDQIFTQCNPAAGLYDKGVVPEDIIAAGIARCPMKSSGKQKESGDGGASRKKDSKGKQRSSDEEEGYEKRRRDHGRDPKLFESEQPPSLRRRTTDERYGTGQLGHKGSSTLSNEDLGFADDEDEPYQYPNKDPNRHIKFKERR